MTSVLKSLNEGLDSLLKNDSNVFVLGEDLADPYGGAFKVTKGLSTTYPERVISTPISEAAMVGMAGGMALKGLKPIVEIMFGDFVMLCADQILNHITKYRWMYNEKVSCPVVIRAPMGGRRGYGPTHSQTLEKHFLGVPGLRVVAVNRFVSPSRLLHAAVGTGDPVLFIENKILYPQDVLDCSQGRLLDGAVRFTESGFPTATVSWTEFEHADVTVVAYGGMADVALRAGHELMLEEEIACEVVVPSQIKPMEMAPLLSSVASSGALAVFEEGTEHGGWGREIIYQASRHSKIETGRMLSMGALNMPIGNAKTLESKALPQIVDVKHAIRSLTGAAMATRPTGGSL
jgi:pyruvate/2-oxoglutarate/acetoin dehydrogenase E1 component